ncbi:protection of telomeres protein 1b isoform X1 [Senna tora]|uniref:Protection of telomeres protein 1b isoform X1 n=1 Tax=Senna tora TaxID=362788 RepID=A0A834WBZ0_9FABA|nr:protection of telomeres protein 1b isoform X1 [Senna tora]
MGTTEHYKFLPIRDAMKSINQKVNVMGIIFEFGFPKRTRGTDYCCTLKIIDESHHQTGMSVNIFAETSEGLPHVAANGDIIQLSNVVVKTHGGEVNAVFNKKFSSFALYSGKDTDDFVPYQVSSKFHRRDMDKNFVVKLRKWLVNFHLFEDSSNFPMLREIKEGDCCNLACKILHFCEAVNDEWMFFVWDGTDAPPNSISAKVEDEMHNPFPLHLEPTPLPRELLCTFPTVGSILRITYDQGIEKNHTQILHIDKWVKIVNMRLEVHAGLWRGVLTPYTKLRFTPNDDCLVLERQRWLSTLLARKITENIRSVIRLCFPFTETNHDNVLPVTLMDVLTHSEVTAKFRCTARVVAATPWPAEKFFSPIGAYRMRLTLEDPTARIHAYVYAEDGVTLFEGKSDNNILTDKMNILLGVTVCDNGTVVKRALRNPPWVHLCLKSFYTSKHDVWGSRRYRIFDTKIVGGA